MQSVDIAKFLDLIDDMLLYNPISEKTTVETYFYAKSTEKALSFSKKLMSGYLELVICEKNIVGEYFLFGTEDCAANFIIAPPSESSDSIRDKLRPVIILDAKSQQKQLPGALDLLRAESSTQLSDFIFR